MPEKKKHRRRQDAMDHYQAYPLGNVIFKES
jgi:hypothetical protein